MCLQIKILAQLEAAFALLSATASEPLMVGGFEEPRGIGEEQEGSGGERRGQEKRRQMNQRKQRKREMHEASLLSAIALTALALLAYSSPEPILAKELVLEEEWLGWCLHSVLVWYAEVWSSFTLESELSSHSMLYPLKCSSKLTRKFVAWNPVELDDWLSDLNPHSKIVMLDACAVLLLGNALVGDKFHYFRLRGLVSRSLLVEGYLEECTLKVSSQDSDHPSNGRRLLCHENWMSKKKEIRTTPITLPESNQLANLTAESNQLANLTIQNAESNQLANLTIQNAESNQLANLTADTLFVPVPPFGMEFKD
nr:Glutaminyl-tRNA synthetase [Ipomoea batatas]